MSFIINPTPAPTPAPTPDPTPDPTQAPTPEPTPATEPKTELRDDEISVPLTPEEQKEQDDHDIARKIINFIILILKKCKVKNIDGDQNTHKYSSAFNQKNNFEVTQKLVPALIDLINSLNSVSNKQTTLTKSSSFNEIIVELINKLPKPQDTIKLKDINALVKFSQFFTDNIQHLVNNISKKKNIKNFWNFIKNEINKKQQSAKTQKSNNESFDNAYFAVFIPEEMRCNDDKEQVNLGPASGHCTIAFKKDDKTTNVKKLGTIVDVEVSPNIVKWQTEDGTQYAYRIVRITFSDNTDFIGHMSIHIKNGGKNFSLNHQHQHQNKLSTNTSFNLKFRSMFIPHPHEEDNKVAELLQIDLDETLFSINANNKGQKTAFTPEMLNDPNYLTEQFLTPFGKFIRLLKIPFCVVTSRRKLEDHMLAQGIEKNIREIFTECTEISYGTKITCDNETERSTLKAICKSNRLSIKGRQNVWGIDDESIVSKTRGFGSTVLNNLADGTFTLTNYYNHDNIHKKTNNILKIAITGTVAIGKSTLLEALVEKLLKTGQCISLGDFGTKHDNGDNKIPLVVVFSSDGNCPKYENIPTGYSKDIPEDRLIIQIFDSTGCSHPLDCPCFNLGEKNGLTICTFVGCLKQLFNRSGHATLNGLKKFNLFDTRKQTHHSPIDTNNMNISEFINNMWHSFGKSEHSFTKAMSALNQTAKFSYMGDLRMLVTSYRNGQQQWIPTWGTQNRNIVHYLVDDIWVRLMNGLPAGIENQQGDKQYGDIYEKEFSSESITISNALRDGKKLPKGTYVTSKHDGSLGRIHVVRNNVELLYRNVMKSNNIYAKMLAIKSYKESGGTSFMMIATNGTYLAPQPMWDYMTTAFAPTCGISREELQTLMNNEPSEEYKTMFDNLNASDEKYRKVLIAWSHMVAPLDNKLQTLFNSEELPVDLDINGDMTILFEMICANRTTCLGVIHEELALGYTESKCSVLGIMSKFQLFPHFEIDKTLVKLGFLQPLYWEITTPTQILNMKSCLQQVSLEQKTIEYFLTKFPPSNSKMPLGKIELDHEGLILLVPQYISCNGRIICVWNYSKIKTWIYYMLHKISENSIAKAIKLVIKYLLSNFPLASKIRETLKTVRDVTIKDEDALTGLINIFKDVAPSKPATDNNIKEQKLYSAYIAVIPSNLEGAGIEKRIFYNIQKWAKFILSNLKSDIRSKLYIAIYRYIMQMYGADHIVELYIKNMALTNIKPQSNDAQLRTLMSNSMDTVTALLFNNSKNEFALSDIESHIIFMLIKFPAPVPVIVPVDVLVSSVVVPSSGSPVDDS